MAYVDQPLGRGDDAFRCDLCSDFPRRARRARLDGVVSRAGAYQLGDLAKFPQRADVGRVCGLDLFHGLGLILVYRFSSGLGDLARPGNHKDQEVPFWNLRPWLAWLESALASYEMAYLLFGGLSTPLVLSVHSLGSFDFATSVL